MTIAPFVATMDRTRVGCLQGTVVTMCLILLLGFLALLHLVFPGSFLDLPFLLLCFPGGPVIVVEQEALILIAEDLQGQGVFSFHQSRLV